MGSPVYWTLLRPERLHPPSPSQPGTSAESFHRVRTLLTHSSRHNAQPHTTTQHTTTQPHNNTTHTTTQHTTTHNNTQPHTTTHNHAQPTHTDTHRHTQTNKHTQTHTNIYWKIHGIMELFWYRLHLRWFCADASKVFLVPVFVPFRNAACCVLCCRTYPLKVTGHLERYRADLHDPCL